MASDSRRTTQKNLEGAFRWNGRLPASRFRDEARALVGRVTAEDPQTYQAWIRHASTETDAVVSDMEVMGRLLLAGPDAYLEGLTSDLVDVTHDDRVALGSMIFRGMSGSGSAPDFKNLVPLTLRQFLTVEMWKARILAQQSPVLCPLELGHGGECVSSDKDLIALPRLSVSEGSPGVVMWHSAFLPLPISHSSLPPEHLCQLFAFHPEIFPGELSETLSTKNPKLSEGLREYLIKMKTLDSERNRSLRAAWSSADIGREARTFFVEGMLKLLPLLVDGATRQFDSLPRVNSASAPASHALSLLGAEALLIERRPFTDAEIVSEAVLEPPSCVCQLYENNNLALAPDVSLFVTSDPLESWRSTLLGIFNTVSVEHKTRRSQWLEIPTVTPRFPRVRLSRVPLPRSPVRAIGNSLVGISRFMKRGVKRGAVRSANAVRTVSQGTARLTRRVAQGGARLIRIVTRNVGRSVKEVGMGLFYFTKGVVVSPLTIFDLMVRCVRSGSRGLARCSKASFRVSRRVARASVTLALSPFVLAAHCTSYAVRGTRRLGMSVKRGAKRAVTRVTRLRRIRAAVAIGLLPEADGRGPRVTRLATPSSRMVQESEASLPSTGLRSEPMGSEPMVTPMSVQHRTPDFGIMRNYTSSPRVIFSAGRRDLLNQALVSLNQLA